MDQPINRAAILYNNVEQLLRDIYQRDPHNSLVIEDIYQHKDIFPYAASLQQVQSVVSAFERNGCVTHDFKYVNGVGRKRAHYRWTLVGDTPKMTHRLYHKPDIHKLHEIAKRHEQSLPKAEAPIAEAKPVRESAEFSTPFDEQLKADPRQPGIDVAAEMRKADRQLAIARAVSFVDIGFDVRITATKNGRMRLIVEESEDE